MQDLKLLARSEKYPVSVILSSQQLHEIESVVDEIYFLREGSCLYGGEMKAFGKERQHNSFELSGEFTRSDLYELLSEEMPSVKIEDNGQAFMLDIPREVEPNAVLRKILERHRVAYFRDISQSARRLFQR
jgi:ABC-2 type transport system ATP-binding protein